MANPNNNALVNRQINAMFQLTNEEQNQLVMEDIRKPPSAEPTALPNYVVDVENALRGQFQDAYDTYKDSIQEPRGDVAEAISTLLRENGALISGGFMLYAIGKKQGTNDIDIYVSCKNLPNINAVLPKIIQANRLKEYMASVYCRSFLKKNGIRSVQTYSFVRRLARDDYAHERSEYSIDIMAVRNKRTPLAVVKNFDLTYCQIWYDGEMVYATHPEHIKHKIGYLQKDYIVNYLKGNPFLKSRIWKYTANGFKTLLAPNGLSEYEMLDVKNIEVITYINERQKDTPEWKKRWACSALLEFIVSGSYKIRAGLNTSPNCIREKGKLKIRRKLINDSRPEIGLVLQAAVPFAGFNDDENGQVGVVGAVPPGAGFNDEENEENEEQGDGQHGGKYINPPFGTTDGYDTDDYEPYSPETMFELAGTHAETIDPDLKDLTNEEKFYHLARLFVENLSSHDRFKNPFLIAMEYDRINVRDQAEENRLQKEIDDMMDPLIRFPANWLPYITYLDTFVTRKGDDYFGSDDGTKLYDFHAHTLDWGIGGKALEKYLNFHVTKEDKNNIPCYMGNDCNKPLTVEQIRPCVSATFFTRYMAGEVEASLEPLITTVNTIARQFLTNTRDPAPLQGWREQYHAVMCPFCLVLEERNEGCAYMTHARNARLRPPYCIAKYQVPELVAKYSTAIQALGIGQGKLEFCVECGRPCVNHRHFNLNNPPGLQDYTSIDAEEVPDFGKCDGGGRPELFARILAMREVLRNTPETNVEGESEEEKEERLKAIRRAAALAADAAPNDEELMTRGGQIFSMAENERTWGNALQQAVAVVEDVATGQVAEAIAEAVVEGAGAAALGGGGNGGNNPPCPYCTKTRRNKFRNTRRNKYRSTRRSTK